FLYVQSFSVHGGRSENNGRMDRKIPVKLCRHIDIGTIRDPYSATLAREFTAENLQLLSCLPRQHDLTACRYADRSPTYSGWGFALQRTNIGLDRNGEHICPIRFVLVICLDEERLERGSNGRHGFVIPNEEAARKGRIQHVERS